VKADFQEVAALSNQPYQKLLEECREGIMQQLA
jgi:hypothetical protein